MKRYVIAALVAASIAGAAFAFANSLTVGTQDLASGSAAVNSGCTGLSANWVTSYVTSPSHYKLATINIHGNSAACQSRFYKVTIAKSDGTSLEEETGQLGATGNGTDAITPVADINAADVGTVTAVLTNAAL